MPAKEEALRWAHQFTADQKVVIIQVLEALLEMQNGGAEQ